MVKSDSETQVFYNISQHWDSKKTNESTHKTEKESQIQKTTYSYQMGKEAEG